MRKALAIKLVVLPVVLFSSWWATTSIMVMAQQARAKAKPLGVAAIPAGASKVLDPSTAAPAIRPFTLAGLHPKMDMLNLLDGYSVTVLGHMVQVHASVSMLSRNPGPLHLWRLKVINTATGIVVRDVPYSEQQFAVDPSGEMTPTFQESLELPAGDYNVIVALYKIGKGVEVADLMNADEKATVGSRIINAVAKISIAD